MTSARWKHFLAPEILEIQATNRSFTRNGNRSRDAAPQGAYPCAGEDEWIVIAIENDAEWQALRSLLGDPEWARAKQLDTAKGRLEAHDMIDEHLANWTRDQAPTDAWRGSPVWESRQSSRNLLEDPQ